MTFPLTHWVNPRATIASTFQHNDIEYATHGAVTALKMIQDMGYTFEQLKTMTVLDYGCGTGRMSRVLTPLFKHVYAYDPVHECIKEGLKECSGMKFPNLTMAYDWNMIPEDIDIAISVSVIEHLVDKDANIMIANLSKKVKGKTSILYSLVKNQTVIRPYLDDEQLATDTYLKREKPDSRIHGAIVDFKVKHR